jgi:tight adherence protein B
MMSFFLKMVGPIGLTLVIGAIIFLFVGKYSVGIFSWIENQTYGTRSYLLEKFDFLFITVNADHLTYLLFFLSFGLSSLVFFFVGLFIHWGLGAFLGVIFFLLGWKLPKPIIDIFVSKRIDAYQLQMVDALTLLANGIRAGLTVQQAIGMVVDEMQAPISQEFGVILQQNRIGVTLEECFENLAKRIPTEDNDMFVSSVNVLKETGGNLAEVFDTIVEVIRERIRLEQKIKTMTAQGFFQGMTIFSMPFLMGAFYTFTDPEGMMKVFTHPLGIIMLLVAVALDFTGLYFILRIVRIKV